MKLHTRRWSSGAPGPVVACVHGIGQHGGVFARLARDLAPVGVHLVAVDLRGHGLSHKQPPWDVGTHVTDLAETFECLGVEPDTWIAHSFGARVALEYATRNGAAARRLALLEPGVQIDPATALARAEIERLDWAFNGPDAAFRVLAAHGVPEHSHPAIRSYIEEDLVLGGDGQYRFSHSPASVAVAWSEMCSPLARPDRTDLLVVHAANSAPLTDSPDGAWLESTASVAEVPYGHNVLWESPEETAAAVQAFLAAA